MSSIIKPDLPPTPHPLHIGHWRTPFWEITVLAQQTLQGFVRSLETNTTYSTEVKAPFSHLSASKLSALQQTIQDNFYLRVYCANHAPSRLEFFPRGVGGMKFYSQQQPLSFPSLVSNPTSHALPKTPKELVSAIQHMKKEDPRFSMYLELGREFIKQFTSNPARVKAEIDSFVMLTLLDNQEITRAVISYLIDQIKNGTLLNTLFVQALADAIDRADPSHLNADDLVQLMLTLFNRVQNTHSIGAEKSQEEQYRAFTRVLNAMADANVCAIPRKTQEEIKKLLSKYSDESPLGVETFANYAKLALTQIPNDESKFAAFLRRATGAGKGIYYFYKALKNFDPGELVNGLLAMKESFEEALGFMKEVHKKISDLPNISTLTKEGFKPRRFDEFDQLRYTEWLIASRSFQALELLLFHPKVRKTPFFLYVLISQLREVILSDVDLIVRQETLSLLQHIYQEEAFWSGLTLKEEHFKLETHTRFQLTCRSDIHRRLRLKSRIIADLQSYVSLPELKRKALETLEAIERAVQPESEEAKFIQRYRSDADEAISTAHVDVALVPTKAKEQFQLEMKLEKIRNSLIEDESFKQEQALYIAQMGTHTQGSTAVFDLLLEVDSFLKGPKKVLLILGDSGSGKSLFSQTLAAHLWQAYQPVVGTIPFLIALPTLKDPVYGLVTQSFERSGFSPSDLQEIKEKREVIFICDAYDEIPQNSDILEGNQLLDFKAKIIVFCRAEALPSKELFIPILKGKPKESLLGQLYIAPFSENQIEHFLKKCIVQGNTEWKEVDLYQQKIDEIQGLKELVQNPFILKIITDTLPEIIDQMQQSQTSEALTRNTLYEAFIKEWFQKGFVRAKKRFSELQGYGLKPDNLIKEATKFCVQLANLFKTKERIHFQYDVENREVEWEPFFGDHPKSVYLRSMAPLKASKEGDYSFLHKSLLEYFVALGSKDAIVAMKPTLPPLRARSEIKLTIEEKKTERSIKPSLPPIVPSSSQQTVSPTLKGFPFFASILEPSIWLFLADVVKKEVAFKQELFSMIERSKKDPEMATAAANAITILNLARIPLARKDFCGIRIPGAVLEMALLAGTDLRGADLTGVNLSGSILNDIKLENARMQGVKFGQWPMIQAADYMYVCLVSPDGKQLIAGSEKEIVIWELASGKILRTLHGHTDRVTALVHNGTHLISSSRDQTVRIWDATSTTPVRTLHEHTNWVSALALFPEGKKIASAGWDKKIHIWDLASGKILKTLEEHAEGVTALALIPEGELLASASSDATIRIQDLTTGKVLHILKGHTEQVTALAYQANRKWLVSAGKDTMIRIWDLTSGKLLQVLPGHTHIIYSLIVSQNGHLISAGEDKTIRIWDLSSGQTLRILQGHTGPVNALTSAQDAKRFLSASNDKTLRIWDIATEKPLKTPAEHTKNVNLIALAPNQTHVLSASWDKTLQLRDLSGHVLQTFRGHKEIINASVFLSDGKRFAFASNDKMITIWDLATGRPLHALEGHTAAVTALALSNKDNSLISASWDQTLRIWDLSTRTHQILQGHTGGVTAFISLHEGKWIASASSDKTVCIWDLASKKPLQILRGHTSGIIDLLRIPGTKHLATVSSDKTISLWDFISGQPIQTLEGHTQNVTAISVRSDGKRLISASNDTTLRVWDLDSGKALQVLQGHTEKVTTHILLPDGKHLVSASSDTTIRIWNLALKKEVGKISHPFGITSLEFKAPDLLFAGDAMGGFWIWKLHVETSVCNAELLSASHPSLICAGAHISNVVGLSEDNERLMLQYGAKNKFPYSQNLSGHSID